MGSRSMRKFFMFVFVCVFAASAHAERRESSFLSEKDIAYVRELRELTRDVDKRSLQEMIDEMENTDYPQVQAVIFEAVALTYDDITRENEVREQKKKEWLYSMVKLNMAYLQLTGGTFQGDSDPVNRRIRFLLKKYLPPEIFKHPGFFQKVDELLE